MGLPLQHSLAVESEPRDTEIAHNYDDLAHTEAFTNRWNRSAVVALGLQSS